MTFIDFPTPRHRLRPGTVVMVALDPVASLAALNDTTAETAASGVVTHKRLAIVDYPLLGSPDNLRQSFCPIGRGLPRDAWASVPILPTESLPGTRAPISVVGKLPFEDAHVHTAHAFEGPVSRLYAGAPSGIRFSQQDTEAVCGALINDRIRLQFGESCGNIPDEDDDSSIRDEQDESDILGTAASNWSAFGEPEMQTSAATLIEPHYRVWLRVDDEEIGDPSTLEAELEQLRIIEAEWRQRRTAEVEAKQKRLDQWLQAITNDGWEYDEDEYVLVGSLPGEDDLAPGDAIDEPRRERRIEVAEEGEGEADQLTRIRETPAGQDDINLGKKWQGDPTSPDAVESTLDAAWDKPVPLQAIRSLGDVDVDRQLDQVVVLQTGPFRVSCSRTEPVIARSASPGLRINRKRMGKTEGWFMRTWGAFAARYWHVLEGVCRSS